MAIVKIKTLTPVHIGSGNKLAWNYDYVSMPLGGGMSELGVIDDRKILELIGKENIIKWALSIERGDDTMNFVRQFAPKAKLEDISSRVIESYCVPSNKNDDLKECIHDGRGIPYIPGSSIKGAIRTAVFTSLISSHDNIQMPQPRGRNLNDGDLQRRLFGNDPQSDFFRFIRVGDAYFKDAKAIALRMVMYLNITTDFDMHPTKDVKPQLIEAIDCDGESSFRLNIEKDLADFVFSRNSGMRKIPEEINNIGKLFHLINSHTKNLVSSEIDFWRELSDDGKDGADGYIEEMDNMLSEVNECKDGRECVLRLGHASGWRFMTGAWSEDKRFKDGKGQPFFEEVKRYSRPNNDVCYKNYQFPKSRRAVDDGGLLGFVKLSI